LCGNIISAINQNSFGFIWFNYKYIIPSSSPSLELLEDSDEEELTGCLATTVTFFFAGLFEQFVCGVAAVAVAAGALDFTGCPRHITGSSIG